MKISAVIPYYQEEPGILARALKSIYAQQLDAQTRLDIIIVNDASPLDPAIDVVSAGTPPANIVPRVLVRANGGPAAARNTGFDAVPADADFVAMLDSDDAWAPNHIARAIEGFRISNADVYFSDYTKHHAGGHFDSTRMFVDPLGGPDDLKRLPAETYFIASGRQVATYAAREFLAHSSTIVWKRDLLDGLRMSERLRWAGEDHNFFIDMALKAKLVCISTEREATLGTGVSIYESSHEWGTMKDLRRRAFNIASVRQVHHRTQWPKSVAADLADAMSSGRRIAGYLLVRRVMRPNAQGMEALKMVWAIDRQTVIFAPFSVLDVFARKVIRAAGFRKVSP